MSQETPETISVFDNVHRTDNVMESLNNLLNSRKMGNTNLVRFYLGLREIEKIKARDAKLAKDTGGSSKPKQKNLVTVSGLCLIWFSVFLVLFESSVFLFVGSRPFHCKCEFGSQTKKD